MCVRAADSEYLESVRCQVKRLDGNDHKIYAANVIGIHLVSMDA